MVFLRTFFGHTMFFSPVFWTCPFFYVFCHFSGKGGSGANYIVLTFKYIINIIISFLAMKCKCASSAYDCICIFSYRAESTFFLFNFF